MKHAKKLAVVLIVLVMVMAVVLTACTEKHDYTVKVIGLDGKPYTTALVQPCLVEDGELSMCYEGVATDAEGVAYLDIGKEIPNDTGAAIDEIEVHLLGLPSTLTYDSVRMRKGETATITLKQHIKNPISGRGTGSYNVDLLTGEVTNMIDGENFDPYVVDEGAYKFSFTSAEQKIYFAFQAYEAATYKVYSTGNVDAAIVQLTGDKHSGLRSYWGEGFDNDNVSETDHNFYYEFEVEETTILQNGGYSYFEISLSNPGDVNKDGVIIFEYVTGGQGNNGGSDAIDVTTGYLYEYQLIGTYYDAPIDGSCNVVMGDDGFYHVGNPEGPVLIATLGTDASVNSKHRGNNVLPRGLDRGFTQIYAEAGLTINENGVAYNYYPLVKAYTEASNSEGRYPITEELIRFLNSYLVNKYGVEWFESNSGLDLPDENPWLVWCGYYGNDIHEENANFGGNEADGSDQDNAIMLETGVLSIDVPAGGSVYYSFFARESTKLVVIPRTDNSKLSVYTQSAGAQSATTLTLTQVESEVMGYEIEIEGNELYFFLFSTNDGEAELYDVVVTEAQGMAEEGSSDNPIEISYWGEYNCYVENALEGLYYAYTVTSDMTLYFDWDENTFVTVIVNGYKYIMTNDEEDAATLINGLQVTEGDEIIITITTNDFAPGDASFTISNTPIAD